MAAAMGCTTDDAVISSGAAGAVAAAGKDSAPDLQLIAVFDHQVTGVAVSQDGRVFVNFPRWTEDTPISVGELTLAGLRPYPDNAWNAWRNIEKNAMRAQDHFVCVQSVVADRGNLWVVDPAAPAVDRIVPSGPKLVRIDLATDRVVQVIAFDETVAPQGSYLNDVRISPDGRHAYMTDSGARGALVVVDLVAGRGRRVLDGHFSTQPERDVTVKADGQELRRPDGRAVEFAADGIALSRDGSALYWQALTGRTLYQISTAVLADTRLSASQLAAHVERVGTNGVADGLWIDRQGRMYISALEENAIKRREGEIVLPIAQDTRLRWPDSFAEGPDGTIYVTSSHIQDMSWFDPETGPQLTTELWRIRGTGAP
jgi:sugar lactone lactonase YvrE